LQAYFTSDRITSDDNIYNVRYDAVTAKKQIPTQKKEMQMQTSVFQGYVLNRQAMEPMKNVTVFMLNKCSGKVLVAKTTENGTYIFPLIKDCDVVFRAVGPEFSTDCFPLKEGKIGEEEKTKKIPQDLLIDKYPENFKWKLKNIYYDFNQWNLRVDAYPVLDSLVKILKNYPIKVELSSHTDCRGSYQYNNLLSQKRAQSAVNYILAKGINNKRIIAKGYGKYRLVNRCADGVPCTESEHQANRRTEVKVLASATKGNVINNFDPSIFKAGQELDTNQLPARFFRNDATSINSKPINTKYELEKKIEAVAKENKSLGLPVPKKNITAESLEINKFSVQILAMKGTFLNARALRKLHNVFDVACADGFTRYLAGKYSTEAEANVACERIHKLGAMYKNAFVVNTQELKILSSSEK